MKLDGSVFIITGGASGLGFGTAQVLVEGGAKVILADVNQETLDKAVSELGEAAKPAVCDVTNPDQVQQAIDLATGSWGILHGAVNCAGIGTPCTVLSKKGPFPLELFDKVVRVNLSGSFNVIRLCAAAMAALENGDEDKGVFINTASVAAFEGQVGQAAYSASKSGVMGMTLPIARELARYGMRVVTIAPGLFDTPMFRGLPEEIQGKLVAQIPHPKRLGSPREFGMLSRQIIENAMINGTTIRFDGALRMA